MNTTTRCFLLGITILASTRTSAQTTNVRPTQVIIKMLPDYLRPQVYALNQSSGGNPGSVLALNPANGVPVSEVVVGVNPTDMAMTPAGDTLYVINTGSRTISKIDLGSFSVVTNKSFATTNTSPNGNPLHLALGSASVLFFTDGDWAPNVYSFDYNTGLSTFVYVAQNNWYIDYQGTGFPNGVGGMVATRSGTTLYTWLQYGWGAGSSESVINRVNPTTIPFTFLETGPLQGRDPIDAPILLDSAEARVFNKINVVAATNVSTLLATFTENIYAISKSGSLAFGPTRIFKGQDGTALTNLPFASTVQAVSGDQQKLLRYDSTSGNLVVYDLNAFIPAPASVTNPVPADGSVVNPPLAQLSYSPSTWALSYRVFLGTNQAAVTLADTNSPLYLGTTPTVTFPAPSTLAPGSTYYWRIDSVGYSTITPGIVWSFTVSPLAVTPQMPCVNGLAGLFATPQTVTLSSSLPVAWTLAIAQPWASASSTNGTTPATLSVTFNVTNLVGGKYTNVLSLTANGITQQYPVVLLLTNLNASQIVADRNRDYLYVLHPGSGKTNDAFLLFLNTDTALVDLVTPIGINPTDMSISAGEDKLYVCNLGYPQTHVVNLATRTELTPLFLGTNVFRINTGRPGRVIIEGPDQVTSASLIDTSSGATLASTVLNSGDAECEPTGQFYYHGWSNPHVVDLYYVGGDSFVRGQEIIGNNFITSPMIASPDDSTIFWCGVAYNTNLDQIGPGFGVPIYACSTNAAVAFGSQLAFDGAIQKPIQNLPVSSAVLAVDRFDQNLWYFNSATHRVESFSMALIRAPKITQQPPTNTTAVLGTNVSVSATAMGLAPLSYQWIMFGTNLPTATNATLSLPAIQVEQAGDYQLVASSPYGSVTSAVAHVVVLLPVVITSQPQSTNVYAGQSFSLSVSATGTLPITNRWTFEGITIAGATNSTLVVSNAQAVNEGVYRAVVQNAAAAATSVVARVRVFPQLPVILAGPASFTVGASSNAVFSVIATGTQPLSYQWLFNGNALVGASGSQYALSNAQAINAGNYQVVVTNNAGAITSAVAALTVAPVAPYFLVQPTGAALPAGTNATLAASAGGSQPIRYQWLLDGTNLAGAMSPSLSLSNLTLLDAGDYSLVASNIAGASTSSVATLSITAAPPVFVQQPVSFTVAAGANTNLSSLAVGSAPLSYQWYFQSNILSSQKNRQLLLNSITLAASGPYYVTASNAFGVVTSSVAQVTVINQSPILQLGLTNLVVDAGTTVTLTISVLASGSPTYTWRYNNTQIATNTSLVLTNLRPLQSGFYRVTVANPYGSVSSTSRVSVFGPPSWVVAWGDDSEHQTEVPTNLDDVVNVTGGDFHTLALHRNGTLLGWGYNGDGQINVPTNPLPFVSIASGAAHNLAINEAGSVVAWGRNDSGQCTVPASANSVLAVAAGDSHSLALLSAGTMVAWGDNTYGQVSGAGSYSGIRSIAAGRNHNLALRTSGTVVAWGFNAFGQASPPAALSSVAAIAAGYLHSAALCSNGTVVVWGDNTYGQTNVPIDLTNAIAIAAGDFHTVALRADGSIVGWGDNSFDQTSVPGSVTNSWSVASGYYHAMALVPVIPFLNSQVGSWGLVLQWNGPFILQWAPAVAGPYTDIPGLYRSWTNIDILEPARFYRLRR